MQSCQDAPADVVGWQTVSRELHFENAHLSVATDEVRSPAQARPRRWTIVHRKRAVIIAPVTADGRLVLVRQERIAIRAAIWEVPAGQIDEPREVNCDEMKTVALRELREETGYELGPGGELLPLGDFFSSPGFTDEHGFFFLARPVQPNIAGPAHQESESILECREFSADEVAAMIARDEIRDANTLSIWAKLIARELLTFAVPS